MLLLDHTYMSISSILAGDCTFAKLLMSIRVSIIAIWAAHATFLLLRQKSILSNGGPIYHIAMVGIGTKMFCHTVPYTIYKEEKPLIASYRTVCGQLLADKKKPASLNAMLSRRACLH